MNTQTAVADRAPQALANRWLAFRSENPDVRMRDAAQQLGVSEAELVASGCGRSAVCLNPEFIAIVERLPTLGRVMALTRNESAVHEKIGQYGNVEISKHVGLVLNVDIDLRLFLSHWKFGFAVTEEIRSGTRRSLQFFDERGSAVHKVYLRDDSDAAAYDRLCADFASADQSGEIRVAAPAPRKPAKPDGAIDRAGFRFAWKALEDTHDFVTMLKKFGVERVQGLRLVGRDLAYRVGTNGLRRALEIAAERRVPIMVFVGNRGTVQIHTGPVKKLKAIGPWFNVLDEGFNLHLREDHIDSAWVVRKPTRDGVVTSLELFDSEGELIATLFGKRKPGEAELDTWRAVVGELQPLADA